MAMLNNQRVFIKKGLIPSSWRKLDVFEIWMGLGWWYAKSFDIYWCWEFMEPVESNVCRWLSWRISRCSGIYASDLKRAHHTAQIYGKALNCEALEDGDGVPEAYPADIEPKFWGYHGVSDCQTKPSEDVCFFSKAHLMEKRSSSNPNEICISGGSIEHSLVMSLRAMDSMDQASTSSLSIWKTRWCPKQ